MADESELQRFRQQWKEEVTKRAQGRPAPSTSTAARPTQRPRPPSFSQTRPTRVITGEDEDEFLPELSSSSSGGKAVTSPPPPRRPSFSISGVPKSALEHYEQAVEKESEGSLGESLRLYRKAFRMDDGVDKAYREKYFPKPKPGDKQKEKAAAAVAATPVVQPSLSVSDLVASFAGLKIEPTTEPALAQEEEEKKQFSLLAAVPSEILLHILHELARTDVSTYVRLSQVCKHLSYVVATEDSIWRSVSKHAFSRQVWDWRVTVTGHPIISSILDPEDPDFCEEEEDELPRVAPNDEDELPRYNNSWREMFHLRPRLRYNGIYISTCNYHRSGGHSGASLSWNTPVHIVTYYRYLRFYPDGSLLSLLTTSEPAEVVYGLSKPSLTPAHLGGLGAGAMLEWAPHVARGRWRVDADGRVDVETEAPNLPRYLFRMQLRIKNVRATRNSVRGAVKLQWEGFWSWNKLTDDLAVFEGRNDKPFFFSRVGAVEKEMEGVV
jgi:F-box protein 9